MERQFTNSCAPISYPCPVGVKYIEPCTCQGYLECQVGGYRFLYRGCGLGTAWNHVTGFCDGEDKIYIGAGGIPVCDRQEPWDRCVDVDNHYTPTRLEEFCDPSNSGGGSGGGGSGSNGGGSGSSSSDSGGGGGDSTGAIVGGVIGGLAVLILLLIAVLWWKKRQGGRKSGKSSLHFRPTIQREPKKEMEEEEVYDVIDEKAVQMSPSHNNAAYGKEKDMQYDNPAFSESTNDYCNLKVDGGPITRFPSPNKTNLGLQTASTKDRRHLSDFSREDDLSRSISVGGTELLVEDSEGYHVGYPSGAIPRQPSPLPPDFDDGGDDVMARDVDYGYDLGKVPLPNDYMELEKTEL